MVFKVSVGSNYFFEIAKLQALRVLWQSLTKDYGLSIDCHILTNPVDAIKQFTTTTSICCEQPLNA